MQFVVTDLLDADVADRGYPVDDIAPGDDASAVAKESDGEPHTVYSYGYARHATARHWGQSK
jgi:hypothetical protein